MQISMRLFNRQWKPSRFASLLMAVGVLFWTWFAWFEWQRMQTKLNIQATYQQRTRQPALTPSQLNALSAADLKFRRIVLHGHYDAQHSFLLDNKIYQHHLGVEVITPFQIAGDARQFLINRGWRPRLAPAFITPSEPHTLRGLIYIRDKQPLLLDAAHLLSMHWPKRLQRIDYPAIQAALHAPTHPFIVLLDADQPNGFTTDWKSVTMVPYRRHLGYTIQFAAIALAILILYISLNLKKVDDDQ